MKQNKGTQYQRYSKSQHFENLDADVENARKSVERKLNYLSEVNRVTTNCNRGNNSSKQHQRLHRSSEGMNEVHQQSRRKSGGGIKNTSESKMKEEVPINLIQKSAVPPDFVLSPRRNGLSPRDPLDDYDEDDDSKLADGCEPDDEYVQRLTAMRHTNRRSHLSLKHMNRPTYSCSSCGATFHIKSLLGAHRRTHDDDFKVRFRSRRLRHSDTVIPSAAAAGKQCKFCDRYFDLERALRIHQLCHCNKITPQQRRKLGYTDLAHEKKNAPLPNFQRMQKGGGHATMLPMHTVVPDPNMPYVALGPAAIKMIEQEQQMKAKRRSPKYTVKVAGPMGRWR